MGQCKHLDTSNVLDRKVDERCNNPRQKPNKEGQCPFEKNVLQNLDFWSAPPVMLEQVIFIDPIAKRAGNKYRSSWIFTVLRPGNCTIYIVWTNHFHWVYKNRTTKKLRETQLSCTIIEIWKVWTLEITTWFDQKIISFHLYYRLIERCRNKYMAWIDHFICRLYRQNK